MYIRFQPMRYGRVILGRESTAAPERHTQPRFYATPPDTGETQAGNPGCPCGACERCSVAMLEGP